MKLTLGLNFSADPKLDHVLEEKSSEEITNPDGTVDVKKTFSLLVSWHV
jgi:hypothetical protein